MRRLRRWIISKAFAMVLVHALVGIPKGSACRFLPLTILPWDCSFRPIRLRNVSHVVSTVVFIHIRVLRDLFCKDCCLFRPMVPPVEELVACRFSFSS